MLNSLRLKLFDFKSIKLDKFKKKIEKYLFEF